MRPITDPKALAPGATLYHSAFGFAQVERVLDGAIDLSWEREGSHLPRRVRFDALQRVYSLCADAGFFHRVLRDREALRRTLLERPADALVWLLEDLAAPQRLRDVMDWLVGRELFTAKTFVRWWGSTEAAVRADDRLSLEGEWLHLRAADQRPLTQLQPGAVEAEAEVDLDAPVLEELDDAVLDGPLTRALESAPFATPRAVPLGEAQPPAATLPDLGRALAEALARAHAEGELVHPNTLSTVLHPDGTVRFEPAGPASGTWAEPPAPGADLRAAAIVLIEAFTGRPIPPLADPADLLPHLRHRLPELPPASLAPLFTALRPHPDHRPTAAAWLEQWRAVCDAEAARRDAADPATVLVAGYDSHVGRTKLLLTQTNQDALYVGTRGAHGVFVLADGISISDAGRGEVASWLAVHAIARLWQAIPLDRVSPRRLLDRGLHLANRTICEGAVRAAGGDITGRMPMGTTTTVAVTHGNRVHLAWLGDSRAYLVGPYGVSLLTADDNVSGEWFHAWCEGHGHGWNPDGHALVRYLGHFDERGEPAPLPAHHASFVLAPGERLVICSDGITDYIEAHEAEVAHRLRSVALEGAADDASRALVALANKMGGGDNASVIVIEVERPPGA